MAHLHPHRSDADEVFRKYLDRAIVSINELSAEITTCDMCSGERDHQPVLGTGHPLADIFLLKSRPQPAERSEGVAFYGPAGDAVLRSVQRLNIDPVDLYGTNCIKCATANMRCTAERNAEWVRRELAVVDPRLVVAMGEPALRLLHDLALDGAAPLEWRPGTIQPWLANRDVLACPDIDESLTTASSKHAFWTAFRTLRTWYEDRPPY